MKNPGNNSGFTLIELMVSVVVAGFVFIGVLQIFQTQLAFSLGNQDENEMQASTQAAINMITNDIVMAGFGKLPNTLTFTHTNNDATQGGSDNLVISTSASGGWASSSFLVWGGPTFNGDEVPVRCFGRDGDGIEVASPFLGDKADPTRDAMYIAGVPSKLLFVSPFTGKPLPNVVPNPVDVLASAGQLDPAGRCWESLVDQNGDGNFEPIIKVKIASAVAIPKGTSVYTMRGAGAVTYGLTVSDMTLRQNGVPILIGVEDFQVRYFDRTGCIAGCDSLTGIDSRNITHVSVGMVVRNQRPDPITGGDLLGKELGGYQTYDHLLPVTLVMEPYVRHQFFFTVRPKNNAL